MIPFPCSGRYSTFLILTLDLIDLSSFLKCFSSLVMWFLKQLSTNELSLEFFPAKQVATNSCSSSCWSAICASFGCCNTFYLKIMNMIELVTLYAFHIRFPLILEALMISTPTMLVWRIFAFSVVLSCSNTICRCCLFVVFMISFLSFSFVSLGT